MKVDRLGQAETADADPWYEFTGCATGGFTSGFSTEPLLVRSADEQVVGEVRHESYDYDVGSESREQVEDSPKRQMYVLEKKNESRSKTGTMGPKENCKSGKKV